MKTIHTSATSETGGKLHLEIPVEKVGQEYIVTVLVAEANSSPEVSNWPAGYLESVIGKWEGDRPEDG